MKAIVCDKCGKAVLLEDSSKPWVNHVGIFVLTDYHHNCTKLELCEECVEELMAAVRRTKDGDGNGE